VSKVTQDLLAYQYFKSYGLDVVRTRAFNHTGPRRGEVFAESSFAKQVVECETGENMEHVISVGNLEASRDYTDVRDMVRAYWLALEKGEKGEVYNICSGYGHSIKFILDSLISDGSVKDISIIQDPTRMRPSDVPILLGDCSKFKSLTGWDREIPIAKTLNDLLNYWRGKKGVTQKCF
jgi:GDP-4-dehydro-6-deoxy-D-mannose reductase